MASLTLRSTPGLSLGRLTEGHPQNLLMSSTPTSAPCVDAHSAFAGLTKPKFDTNSLRQLCDSARLNLHKNKTLGPRAEEVNRLLLEVVQGEYGASTAICFATVRDAHLDKLLVDMIDANRSLTFASDEFRANSRIAQRLQKQWQIRFQDNFFGIDHERLRNLTQTGRLKDVEFVGPRAGTWELWQAKSSGITSGLEETQTLKAGHWWLNLACAHRDGIVGSVCETPTKGRYDHAALPLMSGREDVYRDRVRYSRRGNMADMHLSLMSRVGKELCVLRGSELLSPLAPKAGVRYDGKYRLMQYGFKWKPTIGLYELIIEMVRSEKGKDGTEQPHMKEVVKTPSPSELDDWKLYDNHESEMLRQRLGNPIFMDWYLEKGKRQGEREHWRRLNELRLDLGKLWDMSDS